MRKRSLVFTLLVLAGCATSGGRDRQPSIPPSQPTTRAATTAPKSNEPLRQQIARAAEKLHGKRFSALLHFENEADEVFVSAAPSAPSVDRRDAHTGRASLALAPRTGRAKIKLSSVLAGRDFPGEWTLIGLYLHSDEPIGASISCEENGQPIASRKLSLPAGGWTAAMLEISDLPAAARRGELTLELRFDQPAGNVRCDDLLLIDNRQTLVDAAPDGWTVRRVGLRIRCERKLRFNFDVVTTDGSPVGWDLVEANVLRARFASSGGEAKALTVYADGRSLWDGAYKPLSAEVREDKTFAAAHASPAELAVAETTGRVNRSTPGDADNDGYNELLGAYQLQATGGRLELTMTPRGTPVPRPVLQIAGLPEGKALITIEGRLVERSARLDDGQLLVELPARITRATLVTVRVQ